MSYIVAPSSQKEYELVDSAAQGTTIQQPSSYINHFSNPIKIKKNSEIALMSAKINRADKFDVRNNAGYYVYLGNELSAKGQLNNETTTPVPYVMTRTENNTLDINQDKVINGGGITSQTPKELVETLDVNMKNLYHPEFRSQGSAGFQIDTSGEPKNRSFGGFKFNFKQNTALATETNASFNPIHPSTTFEDIESASKSASITISASGGSPFPTVTRISESFDDFDCMVMGTDFPLALNDGSANFHIGVNASEGGWQIGMSRPKQVFNQAPSTLKIISERLRQAPPYFKDNGNIFFDWAVRVDEDTKAIEVIQTIVDANGDFTHSEVEYWTGTDANSDFTANASNEAWSGNTYTDVKFTAIGERMLIELYNAKTSKYVKLADCSDPSDKLAKTTKPINQNCFFMYPLIDISKQNASIGLTQYNGRKTFLLTDTIAARTLQYTTSSFYGSCMKGKILGNYGIEAIKDLDFRKVNRINQSKSNASLIGLNASGGVAYSTVMITEHAPNSKSTRYMNPQTNPFAKVFGANATDYLGFSPMSEVPRSIFGSNLLATADSDFHFSSISVPKPYSRSNSFVRINDLPIESYNGANSGISKIIGTIPRFDNSNDEVGSLNFDIANPVYLDLNNTDDIKLNQIKIDFVNIDETLVTDLTGTSVITLHIREKK